MDNTVEKMPQTLSVAQTARLVLTNTTSSNALRFFSTTSGEWMPTIDSVSKDSIAQVLVEKANGMMFDSQLRTYNFEGTNLLLVREVIEREKMPGTKSVVMFIARAIFAALAGDEDWVSKMEWLGEPDPAISKDDLALMERIAAAAVINTAMVLQNINPVTLGRKLAEEYKVESVGFIEPLVGFIATTESEAEQSDVGHDANAAVPVSTPTEVIGNDPVTLTKPTRKPRVKKPVTTPDKISGHPTGGKPTKPGTVKVKKKPSAKA